MADPAASCGRPSYYLCRGPHRVASELSAHDILKLLPLLLTGSCVHAVFTARRTYCVLLITTACVSCYIIHCRVRYSGCARIPASWSRPRSGVSQPASDGRRLTSLEAGFVGRARPTGSGPSGGAVARSSVRRDSCSMPFVLPILVHLLYVFFSSVLFLFFFFFFSSLGTARISPLLMDSRNASLVGSSAGSELLPILISAGAGFH